MKGNDCTGDSLLDEAALLDGTLDELTTASGVEDARLDDAGTDDEARLLATLLLTKEDAALDERREELIAWEEAT